MAPAPRWQTGPSDHSFPFRTNLWVWLVAGRQETFSRPGAHRIGRRASARHLEIAILRKSRSKIDGSATGASCGRESKNDARGTPAVRSRIKANLAPRYSRGFLVGRLAF